MLPCCVTWCGLFGTMTRAILDSRHGSMIAAYAAQAILIRYLTVSVAKFRKGSCPLRRAKSVGHSRQKARLLCLHHLGRDAMLIENRPPAGNRRRWRDGQAEVDG